MKRLFIILTIPLTLMLLTACNFFSQPADLQAESLQAELARTQIALVRETATVFADRLLVTQEYAETAVESAALQSTRMSATLVAQGTTVIDIAGITPMFELVQPDLVMAATNAALSAGVSNAAQIANPMFNASLAAPSGGEALAQPTPPAAVQLPANSVGPSLTNILLTTRVGADDCPIAPATSFRSEEEAIYVTAVANGITPGTRIEAVWFRETERMMTYDWTPTFAINGACIWFRLPASEVWFRAGRWSVEMSVNGTRVGSTSFNFVGNAAIPLNPGS